MKNAYFKNKRGVIDVQFNWIFILVAGFVIFLFIISIVFSQKKHSDQRAGIASVNQITTLLKGKQQTSNVYSEISIPSSSIEFRCDKDTNIFSYRVGESERVPLPTQIMFARGQIDTNKIIIWTQAFDTGFPVGVFSYLTTPDSAILIYGQIENSAAAELYQSIPGNISRFIVRNAVDIARYEAYKNKVIVCFSGDCPSRDYEYINISAPKGGAYPYGNITFHKKNSLNDVSVPYITQASIYGAIFSNDANYYSCQMNRAMEQYDIKRTLIKKRLEIMQLAYDQSECGFKIKVITDNDLLALPKDENNRIEYTHSTVLALNSRATSLQIRNTDLVFSSCPRLY